MRYLEGSQLKSEFSSSTQGQSCSLDAVQQRAISLSLQTWGAIIILAKLHKQSDRIGKNLGRLIFLITFTLTEVLLGFLRQLNLLAFDYINLTFNYAHLITSISRKNIPLNSRITISRSPLSLNHFTGCYGCIILPFVIPK